MKKTTSTPTPTNSHLLLPSRHEAMSNTTQTILRHAFTHIPTYGFTRQSLALASASVSPTGTRLGDTAISALFGAGSEAEKTLLKAWMEEGRMRMCELGEGKGKGRAVQMEDVLQRRLEWNEPVLDHLKDVSDCSVVSSILKVAHRLS